jgi:hypothetical protein
MSFGFFTLKRTSFEGCHKGRVAMAGITEGETKALTTGHSLEC